MTVPAAAVVNRSMRTGRNEPCPCGSGSKYKNCCINEKARQHSRYLTVLVIAVATVAAAGVIPSLLPEKEKEKPALSSRTPRPGKVWSEEHGHWHDAAAPVGGAPISPAMTPLTPAQRQQQQQTYRKPQPPGPAPEGKVWSPEHGHWHDVKK
jgi:hypothetical protein